MRSDWRRAAHVAQLRRERVRERVERVAAARPLHQPGGQQQRHEAQLYGQRGAQHAPHPAARPVLRLPRARLTARHPTHVAGKQKNILKHTPHWLKLLILIL